MIGPTDVLPHKRIISEQFMGASSSRQMPVPNTNSDHSEISQREENQIKIDLFLPDGFHLQCPAVLLMGEYLTNLYSDHQNLVDAPLT